MTAPVTSTVAPDTLVARVRRLDGSPDILDRLGPGGFAWLPEDGPSIATAGSVISVAPADAAATLAEISVDGPPDRPEAVRPLAVGALGWELDQDLTIPSIATVSIDDQMWVIEVGPLAAASEPSVTSPSEAPPATSFHITAVQDRETWCRRIAATITELSSSALEKVVLAREVLVEANTAFDRRVVAGRLRRDQPGCITYVAGDLVGASPELLISRRGPDLLSRPMAGTVPRLATVSADDAAVDRLLHSAKDGREHELVVEAVASTLAKLGAEPSVAGTCAQRFASVTHLVTEVRAVHDDLDAAVVAAELHPTPAVGGTPTEAAIAHIADVEGFDRGVYAGPVGWVDAAGDGDFLVALRGATIDDHRARLIVGAGILVDSDPAAEWEETQAKLDPILRALVRP